MRKVDSGFNFIQVMLAMVVVSVGFLGIATMMLKAQEAKKRAKDFQTIQAIASQKLAALASQDILLLATGATAANKILYGAPAQEVVSYGPVNAFGQTSAQSSQGPFPYTVSFVTCLDNLDGGASAASQGGDPCGAVTTSRPADLSCDVTKTNEGEVEVKILATYRDRQGGCHKAALSNILVDMEM